jgi:hypothetical protein
MSPRTTRSSRPTTRDRTRPTRRGRPSLPSPKQAMTAVRPSAGYAHPPGAHTLVADPVTRAGPEF